MCLFVLFQVLITGGRSDPRTLELIRVVRSRLLPGRVLAIADPSAETPAGMSDIREFLLLCHNHVYGTLAAVVVSLTVDYTY